MGEWRSTPVDTSDHVRISRNRFALSNGSDAKWLLIDGGTKVRVDHNRFENKTTGDSLLLVDPDANGVLGTYTLIDRNYFRALTAPGSDTNEAVRVGFPGVQNDSGGRPCSTTCSRTATGLRRRRRGHLQQVVGQRLPAQHVPQRPRFAGSAARRRNLVEGNYFLSNTGGFRMFGEDQTVLGNYFQGMTGARPACFTTFIVGSGDTAADGSDTDGAGYDQPNGGTIAFNTLVANTNHFVIGRGTDQPLPARNIRFGSNIAVGSSGELVYFYGNSPQNFVWEGNIVYGAARGDIAASSSVYTTVNTDLDGQSRVEPKDTGADEYSTAALQRLLLPADGAGRVTDRLGEGDDSVDDRFDMVEHARPAAGPGHVGRVRRVPVLPRACLRVARLEGEPAAVAQRAVDGGQRRAQFPVSRHWKAWPVIVELPAPGRIGARGPGAACDRCRSRCPARPPRPSPGPRRTRRLEIGRRPTGTSGRTAGRSRRPTAP